MTKAKIFLRDQDHTLTFGVFDEQHQRIYQQRTRSC